MSMMQEIEKLMGEAGTSGKYRLVNLGGTSLYIEGIKSAISFGSDEMQFKLKSQLLIIGGNQLKIKYLDKSSCVITGEIFSAVVK